MKKIAIILLAMLGISCTKESKKQDDFNIIDALKETTPLMQPYLCLAFSKEECDSIRNERQERLDKYAAEAKMIKNEDASIDFFMSKLTEIRNDVSLDYMRALNHNLSRQ